MGKYVLHYRPGDEGVERGEVLGSSPTRRDNGKALESSKSKFDGDGGGFLKESVTTIQIRNLIRFDAFHVRRQRQTLWISGLG